MDPLKFFSHEAVAEVPQESAMGAQSQKCKSSAQAIRGRPSHQLQHPPREETQEVQQAQLTIEGEKALDLKGKRCLIQTKAALSAKQKRARRRRRADRAMTSAREAAQNKQKRAHHTRN